MKRLGINELRDNIREILRVVEEEGDVVEVTNQGRVVARVIPVPAPHLAQHEVDEIIADMDRVAAELGAHWPPGVTAADALNDVRG